MPSSPIQGFSMADSSTPNSFDCTSSLASQFGESDSELKNGGAYRYNQGHTLLRTQRPIILQAHKSFSRRRFTFSGNQDQKVIFKKRRRFTSVALPTKFLLGGNINDPLNLGSLQDEKINQKLNEFSPASSPMPTSHRRTQVQVMIPPNIHDPLNLNTGESIEFNLLHSKPRKRRRHRHKGRREDSPTEELPSLEDSGRIPDAKEDPGEGDKPRKTPALRGSPCKTSRKAALPKSGEESAGKQAAKHRKTKVRQDTVTFRANTENFCYGNHVANKANWNPDGADVDCRLRLFDERFFHSKDVLDIGCNAGELSLHIASRCHPKRVVGVDIDKKLVNRAQRTVRLHLSKEVEGGEEFPASMAALYGPLSKWVQSTRKDPLHYPNNLTFLEANYVPASEDFLETQKPEYDTILCLRVTKWIHLNFGDAGLKMAFKRMYAQLRYGGVLILEPQPWFTYSANKKITPAIYSTYQNLKLRPEKFCNYLLSTEVGFSSCQLLGKTFNYSKGYHQDIFILKKENPHAHKTDFDIHLSPIPFHYNVWNCEQRAAFPPFEGSPAQEAQPSASDKNTVVEGDYTNFENQELVNFENQELVNLEHSNECLSDCEEHSNEVFAHFES